MMESLTQLLAAPLPDFRVKQARPFNSIGVDFAGPLFVKNGKKVVKVYICLFTCSVTRAIHLEMVESLNTSAFIHCLRRFTGRRGVLSLIVSDNAQLHQGS